MISALKQQSVFRLAVLIGAAFGLPGLGSVGLWDPWESHYVEVGRQMLARADLIHPFWQNAWFFSKPPLTPWLAAASLWVSGAQPWGAPGSGPLPSSVEWFIRLPFAALLIAAGALLAETVARVAGRRAGLFVALVWVTTPMLLFMTRQVMTDGPFVAFAVIAACAFEHARHDRRWWVLGFSSVALAVLAKGLMGLLPVVVVAAAWSALEGRAVVTRLKSIPWKAAVLLPLIAAPWFIAMVAFDGRDDEGKTFVERFFLYDHLNRFSAGVHTTTPGGFFTYFIEQLAWALSPWLLLVPAGLQVVVNARRDDERWRLLVTWGLWFAVTFVFLTSSATRFHHYVLPMVPPLVVLIALAADALLDDLRAFVPALIAGGIWQALALKDLIARPRHWLDLFTYNHERPYPAELLSEPLLFGQSLPRLLTVVSVGVGVLLVVAAINQSGRALVRVAAGFAVALAAFLALHHWPRLGQHWTQRALVDRYLSSRRGDERLAAFMMNWKGETLYTRNEVTQIAGRDLRSEVSVVTSSAPRTWFLVEHHRVDLLRQTLPAGTRLEVVDATSTNKFVLAIASR